CDLEVGIDLGRDADELILALEERNPLPQVRDGRRHARLPYRGRRLAALRLWPRYAVSWPSTITPTNTSPVTSIDSTTFRPSEAAPARNRNAPPPAAASTAPTGGTSSRARGRAVPAPPSPLRDERPVRGQRPLEHHGVCSTPCHPLELGGVALVTEARSRAVETVAPEHRAR